MVFNLWLVYSGSQIKVRSHLNSSSNSIFCSGAMHFTSGILMKRVFPKSDVDSASLCWPFYWRQSFSFFFSALFLLAAIKFRVTVSHSPRWSQSFAPLSEFRVWFLRDFFRFPCSARCVPEQWNCSLFCSTIARSLAPCKAQSVKCFLLFQLLASFWRPKSLITTWSFILDGAFVASSRFYQNHARV